MKKTKFIVIEGGEGAGKSTLIKLLKEELGDIIHITREPGGSPYAETIRNVALKSPDAKNAPAETMICLMFAARYDHVLNTVVPQLKLGKNVICDRFDSSSYTYQIFGQKGGKKIEKLFWNLRKMISRVPDLYIYIDVDVEVGLRRAQLRNSQTNDGNHFDDRDIDFHKRLQKGYRSFFKKVRSVKINANRSIDEVKRDFIDVVRKELRIT